LRLNNFVIVLIVLCFYNGYAQNLGQVKSISNFQSERILKKASDGSFYKHSKSTMCTGVQSALPWEPINEAQYFVPIDSAAIAWVELADLYVPIRVKWVFIDPKENIYFESKSDWTSNPSSSGYDHWSWWKLWSWIYIDGFAPSEQVNWGEWKVEIYVEENYSGVWTKENTIIFKIDGYNVQINDPEIMTIPKEYSLSQNYPNPFNSTTIITYSLPKENNVSLILFDILGNEIETLVDENKPPGTYQFNLVADNLSSGMYFYQFKSGNFADTKKFILLR
jgi:hypothetical protein